MWRAWRLLDGITTIAVAISNKVLHHKRPWLFPLLDRKTSKAFPTGEAWPGVYDDLCNQQPQFEQLERWFAPIAAVRGGVPLTRLRIHDILLWAKQAGDQLGPLLQAGQVVRGEVPPRRIEW